LISEKDSQAESDSNTFITKPTGLEPQKHHTINLAQKKNEAVENNRKFIKNIRQSHGKLL